MIIQKASYNDDHQAEEMMALILTLRSLGIVEPDMIRLFEGYPRRFFLEPGYSNHRLSPEGFAPIPCGQIQTAPAVITRIIQALGLEPSHKILEIGTGSGYQAALLARLCRRLYTVERFRSLLSICEQRFEAMRLGNVVMRLADGADGWPEQDNFDRIILNVGVKTVPDILYGQLKQGGLLIAPIIQMKTRCIVTCFTKDAGAIVTKKLFSAHFLPMIPNTADQL